MIISSAQVLYSVISGGGEVDGKMLKSRHLLVKLAFPAGKMAFSGSKLGVA